MTPGTSRPSSARLSADRGDAALASTPQPAPPRHLVTSRRLALALGVALLTVAGATPASAGSVGVTHAMTKVRPSTAVPAAKSASLDAAQNEFEPFQIVIGGQATKVSASVSDLVGPGGATIPASEILLYRQGLYQITVPSNSEGATGPWPDPLIPDVDGYAGEKRNAFPFDVPSGESRAIWVEVFVPRGTPAGAYQGAVTVTGTGLGTVTVPIALRVRGFELPSTSSLRTAFGMGWDDPCTAHHGSYKACGSDAGIEKYHILYGQAALDHRISIDSLVYYFGDTAHFDQLYGPLLEGTGNTRLEGARQTTVRFTGTDYSGWRSHFQSKGWSARLFGYTCDEPPAGCSWSSIGPTATSTQSGGVSTLVTTDLSAAKSHGLLDKIDILVPIVQSLHDKGGVSIRQSYDEFLAMSPKKELWWYQSCISHGCGSGCSPTTGTYYTGWPSYVIDASAIQNRAMEWLSFSYDVSGELYFQTTHLLDTAWTNQCDFSGNGDGTLFYPGKPSIIGGSTDIPVESIRLKLIREGMEDYEYLKLLADLGDSNKAHSIASGVFPTPYMVGATEASTLYSGRAQIADRIEQLLGSGPGACTPTTCAKAGAACGSISDGCGGTLSCGTCASGKVCGLTTANQCGTPCVPTTCAKAGAACGSISDGCGGTLTCGSCSSGKVCGLNAPNKCGTPCTPTTCAKAGANCGSISDGCGGTLSCGSCGTGQVCGLDSPNQCGTPCVPTTCAAAGASCGSIPDGCGGTLTCGSCSSGKVCGLNAPNKCGTPCTPTTCAKAGASCGSIPDGCGGTLSCGSCAKGQSCGLVAPNQCGNVCVPKTCATAGASCGAIPDGCGGTLSCGSCAPGQSCGLVAPNQCGTLCVPTTCAKAGASCGTIADGCGGTLSCGSCAKGETCGLNAPNQCGAVCAPTTCAKAGANCGTIADGCGGTLSCGSCGAGQSCGLFAPNQCGTVCVPTTCAKAGATCGTIADGCGGTLSCGSCGAGQSCGLFAPNQCGTPPPTEPTDQTPPAPDIPKGDLLIQHAAVPVTVDGRLGEFAGLDAIEVSAGGARASFRLLWDADYLYLSADVKDGELQAWTTGDDAYLRNSDSVELLLDPLHSAKKWPGSDARQVIASVTEHILDASGAGWTADRGLDMAIVRSVVVDGSVGGGGSDKGYTVELAIPWSGIGVTPTAGMVMGGNLALNDATSKAWTRSGSWTGSSGYSKPSSWKDLVLDAPAWAPVGTPAPEAPVCLTVSCADRGASCGAIDDGCGGVLDCGGCADGEVCGLTADNVCTRPTRPFRAIPRAAGKVAIDGELSEFAAVPAIALQSGDASANVYLQWDATSLYVGASVLDSGLHTPGSGDDGELWFADAIEVMLDPLWTATAAPDADDRHVIVSAAGDLLDAQGAGATEDRSLSMGITRAVTRFGILDDAASDIGYVVELAIPWTSLGITPAAGAVFGADLALNNATADTVVTADWAGLATYAQPAAWGIIQLSPFLGVSAGSSALSTAPDGTEGLDASSGNTEPAADAALDPAIGAGGPGPTGCGAAGEPLGGTGPLVLAVLGLMLAALRRRTAMVAARGARIGTRKG
ncbi:MAG: DUF4091 domain-containing protein [Deltaproteobacteria bacterium]|nr:DUF4091 domain-containing protein [Deltaproteobacteria bacterium]